MSIDERLTKAKERLNNYYEAEAAVLAGQQYSIGSRTLRRADLEEIRTAIKELESHVRHLENLKEGNTSARSRRVIIRDI